MAKAICEFHKRDMCQQLETKDLYLLFSIVGYYTHSILHAAYYFLSVIYQQDHTVHSLTEFMVNFISHLVFFLSSRNREDEQFSVKGELFSFTVNSLDRTIIYI